MKPGERIREKELAERLGISRTPIREALLKLEMAGIVVCNSRRSYNVRLLTADDISEVFEILGILEGAAVASVRQKITEADLVLLGTTTKKWRTLPKPATSTPSARGTKSFTTSCSPNPRTTLF